MDSFFETSPAKVYFKALERWFIELRGAPLQLSPDDFRAAETWFNAGIPLELVKTEIQTVVERRREKQVEVKGRLRYYSKVVEKAFEQRRLLQAPADTSQGPALDLGRRLGLLAKSVPTAAWSAALPEAILSLEGNGAQAIETRLQELEDKVLMSAEESFSVEEEGCFREELIGALDRLRDRLPGGDMVSARERLKRQILRRFLGLPEMSLFGLEASADSDEVG